MSLDWEHKGQMPTIPPPPGVVSNFNSPVSLHIYDQITQGVCLTIATLLVCMRIWTKGYLLRQLGWDDLTSVLAWLGLIAYGSLMLVMDRYGNGRHLWDVKGDDFTEYARLINVTQIIYGPIIFFAKLSIVLLFLRVFNPRRAIRISLHVVLWTNLVFYAASVFVEIWQCKPRMKIWLPLVPGTCVNQRAAQMTSGVFNVVSDFAILVIPIISVWDLHLPQKKKLGLIAIFGTGLLACLASLIRLVLFIEKWRRSILDATWEWYSLDLWTTAEITCAIICGCLSPLPVFVRFMRGRSPLSQSSTAVGSGGNATLPRTQMKMGSKNKDGIWEELTEV